VYFSSNPFARPVRFSDDIACAEAVYVTDNAALGEHVRLSDRPLAHEVYVVNPEALPKNLKEQWRKRRRAMEMFFGGRGHVPAQGPRDSGYGRGTILTDRKLLDAIPEYDGAQRDLSPQSSEAGGISPNRPRLDPIPKARSTGAADEEECSPSDGHETRVLNTAARVVGWLVGVGATGLMVGSWLSRRPLWLAAWGEGSGGWPVHGGTLWVHCGRHGTVCGRVGA
jgi:hypothetical protein